MENTTVADFRGVPYIAVDKKVTRIVVMRGDESFEFTLPEPKTSHPNEGVSDVV